MWDPPSVIFRVSFLGQGLNMGSALLYWSSCALELHRPSGKGPCREVFIPLCPWGMAGVLWLHASPSCATICISPAANFFRNFFSGTFSFQNPVCTTWPCSLMRALSVGSLPLLFPSSHCGQCSSNFSLSFFTSFFQRAEIMLYFTLLVHRHLRKRCLKCLRGTMWLEKIHIISAAA